MLKLIFGLFKILFELTGAIINGILGLVSASVGCIGLLIFGVPLLLLIVLLAG